jgi:penicillin-binding protein 1B
VRPAEGGLGRAFSIVALVVAVAAPALAADDEDPRWRLRFDAPSRLYSRPLVLRTGLDPEREELDGYLRAAGYRRVAGPAVAAGEFVRKGGRWSLGLRPFPECLSPGAPTAPTRVVHLRLDAAGRVAALRDDAGRPLGQVLVEPVWLANVYFGRPVDRDPVRLFRVPPHVVDAVLAVEDRRFFGHHGLDPQRIVGAALSNLRARRVVEGGSTLTQQLVKNLYLTPERNVGRKLREAWIALALEREHPKGEILEAYLNHAYLGQRGSVAVHGVGAAARHHFGRDVSTLGTADGALLAGMLQGPSFYAPLRHADRARARRNDVLRRLREEGHLTDAALRAALDAPLAIEPREEPARGAYFVDWVRGELARRYGAAALGRDGLRIVTSLDWRLQRAAEETVRSQVAALERDHAELRRQDGPRLEAALVALDPRRGDVVALVGGRDPVLSPFNRAVDARRQPGSLFKPVVALAAVSGDGHDGTAPIDLDTVLLDEPLRVAVPDGEWQPKNYDDRFRGRVTLREALEHSLNVPIARLGLGLGLERVAAAAARIGLDVPRPLHPSLLLGAAEVSLLEVAGAYGVLATQGIRARPRPWLLTVDPRRRRLEVEPVRMSRAFAPEATRLVGEALAGAVERGTARGIRAFGYRGPLSAKTGTTNGSRDGWFVAYVPELVVGAWVGFDDGRGIGLTGARSAMPIVAEFLIRALGAEGEQSAAEPAGAPHS